MPKVLEVTVSLHSDKHMGSCQNYGPFLGTLNNRCRIIIGTRKGTIILTTTHIPVVREDPNRPSANLDKLPYPAAGL